MGMELTDALELFHERTAAQVSVCDSDYIITLLFLLKQTGDRFRTFPLRFQDIVKIVAGNLHVTVVFAQPADITLRV